MRKSTLFILLMAVASVANAQKPLRVYLVGDAGKMHYPYAESLKAELADTASSSVVIFLGDNIYPQGLPAAGRGRAKAESTLRAQLALAGDGRVPTYFIPGNHDWAQGRPRGWRHVLAQQAWLDSLHHSNVHWLPRDGCPGPAEVALDAHTTLLLLDTQWFLHPWEKPAGEESACEAQTPDDVFAALEDALRRNAHRQVVVVAHHPIITYGEHGGRFTWKDHLFPLTAWNDRLLIPLPGVGSLYPLYRSLFGNIQDVAHPTYRAMAVRLRLLLEQYPGTIYAAGHEHTLQLSQRDSVAYVVSGSGAKTSAVAHGQYARFVSPRQGYVRLTLSAGVPPQATFMAVDTQSGETAVVHEQTLIAPPSQVAVDTPATPVAQEITVSASTRYEASRAHRWWLGDNYREVWSQSLKVPVLDLAKTDFTILQRGGGQQTLSLRLRDSSGHEYTLRSIEKFPEKAVPEPLRGTFAQDLVQDQISAAHPYAALVVPALAEAAGVYHTNPRLVYLASSGALGTYGADFANQLMLFEERPAGNAKGQPFFGNADKVVSTDKVLEKLQRDNDHRVDQAFVLRARLFDLLIGDWDRHDDQWRWAEFDQKKGNLYRPIPRDRDQAFFVNDGLLPRLWSRKWALPKFQGFDYQLRWTPGFMYNARYFDRSFLTALSRDQWETTARELSRAMTDSVIDASIRQWPADVFQHGGNAVIEKLKTRRNDLLRYAVEQYRFLAREVDVTGSDKNELFRAAVNEQGQVSVSVLKLRQKEEPALRYERLFDPSETKEVRLYGLDGDDQFEVTGGHSPIQLRIIGGEGQDRITNQSGERPLVYDQPAQVQITGRMRDRTAANPAVNEYNRKAFMYDRLAPLLFANINIDDGLFLGGGFHFTRHGFRKLPFRSRHVFLGSYALNTSSYNFRYDGRFTDVVGKWDLELDGDIKSPNYVNNFFGMGNESVFDRDIDDRPGIDIDNAIQYYRLRFVEYTAEARLARTLGSWGYLKAGPLYQHIEIEEPGSSDRFIKVFDATLPSSLIEKPLDLVGASATVGVNKTNDPLLPARGVKAEYSGRFRQGLGNDQRFWSHYATLALYQSFRLPARVTWAVRAGVGHNTGRYAFNLAQVLDGKTELRGFRKTRFYGDSKVFFNNEVRVKLASFRSYLFPASLGVLGFYDTGRVWYADAQGQDPSAADGKSSRWHQGYGGGVWFTPFNLTMATVEAGRSREGWGGYFRLGFLF